MHRMLKIFKFTSDSNIPVQIIRIYTCQRNAADSGRVRFWEYEVVGIADVLSAVGWHLCMAIGCTGVGSYTV
jgi:hypothetical protein